jgi:hypothetical protein
MNARFTVCYLLFCPLLLAGCSQPQVTKRPPVVEQASATEPGVAPAAEDAVKTAIASGPVTFAPAKIGVLPLTELSSPAGAGPGVKLDVFVTMLDAFGCQMKAPGALLFELYEYVPRSAQLKGKQLALWPQIDLTGPAENNRYWRDFLRAYEFELDTGSPTQNSALGGPTQAGRDKTYILEVTCLCPDGKRLSCQYTLKGTP